MSIIEQPNDLLPGQPATSLEMLPTQQSSHQSEVDNHSLQYSHSSEERPRRDRKPTSRYCEIQIDSKGPGKEHVTTTTTATTQPRGTFRKLAQVLRDAEAPHDSDIFLKYTNASVETHQALVDALEVELQEAQEEYEKLKEDVGRLRMEAKGFESEVQKEELNYKEHVDKLVQVEASCATAAMNTKAAEALVKNVHGEDEYAPRRLRHKVNRSTDESETEDESVSEERAFKRRKMLENDVNDNSVMKGNGFSDGLKFRFSTRTGTVPVGSLPEDDPYIVAMNKLGVEMISAKLKRRPAKKDQKAAFLSDLKAFLHEKYETHKCEALVVKGMAIDSFDLIREVMRLGGIVSVIRGRALCYVTRLIDKSVYSRSVPTQLKTYYCKTLYPYEQFLVFRETVTKHDIRELLNTNCDNGALSM